MIKSGAREQAANACVQVLDTEFFKALCEPVRVELFRFLVLHGRSDVGTIAAPMAQDRSVITRHLQLMHRAGLLQSQTEGRHTFYDIDGPSVVQRVDSMAALIRKMAAICCPTH
jgi:predicted transcriptional regulator